MSHTYSRKNDDNNECSGPRPPVLGEESQVKKMIEGIPSVCPKNSPPSYLNWARTLNHLLEDRDGVELFKRYVEEEIPSYTDHLNFYFACEGLKQQIDPEKVKQIIGAIYRFLRKSQLPVSEELRRIIKAGLKNEISLSTNVYDALQENVEKTIRDKIYPNFLCSEIYINYIQHMSAVSVAVAAHHEKLPELVSGDRLIGSEYGVTNITRAGSSSGQYVLPHNSIGGLYDPLTSGSSSGSASAADTLPRSSTLPTLHEDTELSVCNDLESGIRIREGQISADMPLRLTRDLLLATQKRRLEIRPPGAHGYVYTASSSYNPNSRVDSERQSYSSGGRTDSDTVSLSSCSVDGRPFVQKRHSSSECKAIKQNALTNKETNSFQVIPRTQRLLSNEHRPLKEQELVALLIPKLEEVKRKQDLEERTRIERLTDYSELSVGELNDRSLAEAIREKFALDEDNDQDILDQHVSRVWKDLTPHRSPGTISPCPPLPLRKRTTNDFGMLSDGGISTSGHSMRHSKSMSEQSSSLKKLTNKWPSMNTDSGISLFSVDSTIKHKDSSMKSGKNTTFQLEEAKRRLEEESRRSRRHAATLQHPMPIEMQALASSSICSNISQQSPPLFLGKPRQEATTVVFSFCDEEFPYRTKIPSCQPTLKQFKDYLPKRGSFRFFFKTHCEDPDNPVIQEEIVNDADVLPLFEGKVMGLVKPSE